MRYLTKNKMKVLKALENLRLIGLFTCREVTEVTGVPQSSARRILREFVEQEILVIMEDSDKNWTSGRPSKQYMINPYF